MKVLYVYVFLPFACSSPCCYSHVQVVCQSGFQDVLLGACSFRPPARAVRGTCMEERVLRVGTFELHVAFDQLGDLAACGASLELAFQQLHLYRCSLPRSTLCRPHRLPTRHRDPPSGCAPVRTPHRGPAAAARSAALPLLLRLPRPGRAQDTTNTAAASACKPDAPARLPVLRLPPLCPRPVPAAGPSAPRRRVRHSSSAAACALHCGAACLLRFMNVEHVQGRNCANVFLWLQPFWLKQCFEVFHCRCMAMLMVSCGRKCGDHSVCRKPSAECVSFDWGCADILPHILQAKLQGLGRLGRITPKPLDTL